MAQLILASQSPRRRELLSSLGVPYTAVSADIDESVFEGEPPEAYVRRLAIEKATFGLNMTESSGQNWVLGSDTAVVINGLILGKPTSQDEFRSMMKSLSGRTHQVLTSLALISSSDQFVDLVVTEVTFIALTDQQIDAYWKTNEPHDKAGGYGIQGLGSVFVERITGSYSAVVGLPLHETAKLLSQAGLPVWQGELFL